MPPRTAGVPLTFGRHVLPGAFRFAPLFIVIFGIDTPSKIAVVFLLAVFPIVINTATGIRATDNVYLEAARSFCASRNQIFTIARDGRNVRQVTRDGNNYTPSWSQ